MLPNRTARSFNYLLTFEGACNILQVHVVPTDPDLVARADHFENYLANRDYRGFCQEKLSQAQDPHEKLCAESGWKASAQHLEDVAQ